MNVIPSGEIASSLPLGVSGIGERPATGGEAFGKLVQRFVNDTNNQQLSADIAVEQLATGQSDSVHETMLALTKADLSLRLFMEVRNKVIDAYQDVMRMQL
jgi:flagellar hook-basal body complex protein FliE